MCMISGALDKGADNWRRESWVQGRALRGRLVPVSVSVVPFKVASVQVSGLVMLALGLISDGTTRSEQEISQD